MVSALLVAGLTMATILPALASQALVREVASDRLGDAASINDSATPAPMEALHLTVAVHSASASNAAAFVSTLTDPASPNYHKWLTPQQFGEKFGAETSDIATVTSYLQANNFTNIKVWPSKLFVSADSTRAQAEQAFGVKIRGYNRSAEEVAQGFSPTYYAADSAPKVNAQVAPLLDGVFGLSDVAKRKANFILPKETANAATATIGPLLPVQLSSVYNEQALHDQDLNGSGITIAVFSPTTFNEADINQFFTTIGLQYPLVNIVTVNGGATDNTNAAEACLDIETIKGQATNAIVNVYEGPNDGSLDIFNQMATDQPNIVSESYGTAETDVTPAFAASYETLREQMAAEGITIFVASGDNAAYATEGGTVVSVSVDSSSAYVTGVGGTELTNLTTAYTWAGEIGWSYNDALSQPFGTDLGSGGGLSIYYGLPIWQTGLGVSNSFSNGNRQVPDVAAMAGSPNFDIYTNGGFQPVEGTSGACPLWAGSFSLIEQALNAKQGNIDPDLYMFANEYPTIYHDITSGNNGVYDCTLGWDYVTGWGSVDFGLLLDAFQGTVPISATPATAVHLFAPGLQMISTPYSYTTQELTVPYLFTGLVTPTGKAAFDVAAWEPLDDGYVTTPTAPADQPVPGQGYWARFSSNGGSLATAGSPVAALTYGVSLTPGWNMVADPYTTAVPIGNSGFTITSGGSTYSYSTAVQLGLIGPDFYGYNGSEYVPVTTGSDLEPYAGYWLYSTSNTEIAFSQPAS